MSSTILKPEIVPSNWRKVFSCKEKDWKFNKTVLPTFNGWQYDYTDDIYPVKNIVFIACKIISPSNQIFSNPQKH
jgi:hypothetical protein